MKLSNKLFPVLFLLFVYSLEIVLFSTNDGTPANSETTKNKERSIEVFSSDKFCHTSPSKYSISVQNNTPDGFKKNDNHQYRVVESVNSIFIKSGFSQYLHQSVNFLLRYRKVRLLYPSHYFW